MKNESDLAILKGLKLFIVDVDHNASIYNVKYTHKETTGIIRINLTVDVGSISLDEFVTAKLFIWKEK